MYRIPFVRQCNFEKLFTTAVCTRVWPEVIFNSFSMGCFQSKEAVQGPGHRCDGTSGQPTSKYAALEGKAQPFDDEGSQASPAIKAQTAETIPSSSISPPRQHQPLHYSPASKLRTGVKLTDVYNLGKTIGTGGGSCMWQGHCCCT